MTDFVSASELARLFGRSKAAVSQWTSARKLDGCFEGVGRDRRYDVAKCAEALGLRMDPGQRLGNAAATEAARRRLAESAPAREAPEPARRDGALGPLDDDRYKLARIQKAEEEARRERRRNAEEEGAFVLRAAMEREIAKTIGAELAAIEAMLSASARALADELGADFKAARRILRDRWRKHRADRAAALGSARPGFAEDEVRADF